MQSGAVAPRRLVEFADLSGPVVSPNGRQVAFRLERASRELSSMCGKSAQALACVVAEVDGPPRLERIDFDTGSRQLMFEPNAALEFDLEKMHWCSSDSSRIALAPRKFRVL